MWVDFEKGILDRTEVTDILRSMASEKREADSERGRRKHMLFLSNGRNILVGSWQNGYMVNFNNMTKEMHRSWGSVVEVLPVVPFCFEK